mgnify:CR=1 FL=1
MKGNIVVGQSGGPTAVINSSVDSHIAGKAYFYMKKYILSCCSTADLPAEYFSKRGIFYACFHYELDGREYLDEGEGRYSEYFQSCRRFLIHGLP